MTKKILLSVLIGILVIFAAACGNKENEKQTANDEKEPYSVFNKSVFVGDSLLIGLSDVLNDSNVIANAGATAQFALEEVENIAEKKPEDVFLMLGSDDLLWPTDNPQEYSLSYYAQLIERIQAELPDTKIHVLSVPPVTADAMKAEPRYQNIPDYNTTLKMMAETEEIDYIDLSPIFEKHQNLYTEDGIHFKESFYPLLLNQIQNNKGLREDV